MNTKLNSGFTLIELSIVLVIIGLVVGGILVGRDMISASELRATIGQVEKYKTATNAFRLKYLYLPGDLPIAKATTLGFFAGDVGATNQDGNGLVEPVAIGFALNGEATTYWRHLSDANMVDGKYGSIGNAALNVAGFYSAALTRHENAYAMPSLKLGRGGSMAVLRTNGRNYYYLSGFDIPFLLPPTNFATITPVEAAEIDTKMDNGIADVGKVTASNTGNCLTGSFYDVGTTNGNTPNCILFIEW